MFWKSAQPVPVQSHEIVEAAFASQRSIIMDLLAKNEKLQAENQTLRNTVDQAFRDLRDLKTAQVQAQPAGPKPSQDVQTTARRPAFANSSIANRHSLRRPPEPKLEA